MSNYNWNLELVSELIDLFQEKHVLWDTTSDEFKDRDKKHAAWREIGRLMNTNADTVHKKMKMLISQYRRELIKRKPASKWYAFKKLSFLKAHTPRPAAYVGSKNKQKEAGTTYFISIPSQPDEQDTVQDLHAEDERKKQAVKDRLSDFAEPSRRERKKPYNDSTSQETYNKKEIDSETHARDEYTTYGELVAMKLRKIGSNYARSTAQYHINNILYKAEIGAYDQQQNRQNYSFQSRDNFRRAAAKSASQRHDSNDDENSQMSSSASKSMDDLLKLENEDSDE